MKTIESQNKKILAYLLKGHKITALDALKKFGCLRLASRIDELKKHYTITRDWKTLPNGKRVRKYGIAFTLILFLLSSCYGEKGKAIEASKFMYDDIYQIKVDSCEYIVYMSYQKGGITHKGNCKNPIHGN